MHRHRWLYVMSRLIRLATMTSKTNPKCRVCGIELNDETWFPSDRKKNIHICKSCRYKRRKQWVKANPNRAKILWTRNSRKRGYQPFNENKECPAFLGVHITEEVLSRVFKNVQRMPYGNPGYDFICNKGKRIDVKSSCKSKTRNNWIFTIRHNTIADYFLCLAFDNREDLNPLYVWLLPGNKLNHLKSTTISQSSIHKWDGYILDISKVITCCNTARSGRT